MPSAIAVPKEKRVPGPDGMPLIATPQDMDPLGHKNIVTPDDIENLVQKTLKKAEDEPKDKIIIASK